MKFDNIWDLLKDMKNSGSIEILCADGVDGPGFGWVCQVTGRVWAISSVDVGRTGNQASVKDVKILRAYLSNAEGRKKVAEMVDILFTDDGEANANLPV